MEEYIKKLRPSLSESSIKTYTSILSNLYRKVFGDEEIDTSKFNKVKEIMDHLKTLEPNKRKTILSALVIITDKKEYRNQMLEDINDYNNDQNKQVKTENQELSWVEKNDIQNLFDKLKKNATIIYKKENLSSNDYQDIQNFVIIALLGGVFIPPRRSKDYVEFKIKNINTDTDNYIDKSKFVFNAYKTAKTYGKQTIAIPLPLKAILRKWIAINPTEYLLFDSKQKKLSNVKLNQRLNKLFGKKASVNQMRHTYLSDKYGDMIERQNELASDMKDMGSSRIQEKLYIKK